MRKALPSLQFRRSGSHKIAPVKKSPAPVTETPMTTPQDEVPTNRGEHPRSGLSLSVQNLVRLCGAGFGGGRVGCTLRGHTH